MIMGIWAAFVLGLFGSMHCVGMCGPLALALPRVTNGRSRFYTGRVLYNVGRVTTYAMLGAVFGLAGSAARVAGWQQGLSITTGVLMLLWLVLPKHITRRAAATGWMAGGLAGLKRWLTPLFRSNQLTAQFGIGLLNGLLPCGFLYLGLAGAMAQPSVSDSSAFMALFGFGTFPAMLTVSLAPGFLSPGLRVSIRHLLPVGTALIAALLIVRGLALGIPYLSPRLPASPNVRIDTPACHSH